MNWYHVVGTPTENEFLVSNRGDTISTATTNIAIASEFIGIGNGDGGGDVTGLQQQILNNDSDIDHLNSRVDGLQDTLEGALYGQGVSHFQEFGNLIWSSNGLPGQNGSDVVNRSLPTETITFRANSEMPTFVGAGNNILTGGIAGNIAQLTNASGTSQNLRVVASASFYGENSQYLYTQVYERNFRRPTVFQAELLQANGTINITNAIAIDQDANGVVQPISIYDVDSGALQTNVVRGVISSGFLTLQDSDGNDVTLPQRSFGYVLGYPSQLPTDANKLAYMALQRDLLANQRIIGAARTAVDTDYRTQINNGWRLKFPMNNDVSVVSIYGVVIVLGTGVNLNDTTGTPGFHPQAGTTAGPFGSFAPDTQVRIFGTTDELNRIERKLVAIDQNSGVVRLSYMNRDTAGNITQTPPETQVNLTLNATGGTGVVVPGLARRVDNANVAQDGRVTGVNFIDLHTTLTGRQYPDPRTLIQLNSQETHGLAVNPFNGYIEENTPQVNFVPSFTGTVNASGEVTARELTWIASDPGNNVKTFGDQDISGVKTFSGVTNFNSNVNLQGSADLTLNAGTIAAPVHQVGQWTIGTSLVGNHLEFSFGGQVRMRLRTDGTLETQADVSAFDADL